MQTLINTEIKPFKAQAYQNGKFEHVTDEDLKAIFFYLKSIKPISNPVPAPIPPARPVTGRAGGLRC